MAMDINKEELANDIYEYRVKFFTAKFDFYNKLADADKVKAPPRLWTTLFTMIENYARHPSFSGYSDDWKNDMRENAQDCIMTRAIRYDKFTEKSPFAYITMIIHNVFIAEINRRKLEMKVFNDLANGVGEMKAPAPNDNYIRKGPAKWDAEEKANYKKFQVSMKERGVELDMFADKEMLAAYNAHKDIVNNASDDAKIRELLTSKINGE